MVQINALRNTEIKVENRRLPSPSAFVACYTTNAELTSEPVQAFEELGLNLYRTERNRTRQCSARATSGWIKYASSCTAELILVTLRKK